MAYSSTSPELGDIVLWVLDHVFTVELPQASSTHVRYTLGAPQTCPYKEHPHTCPLPKERQPHMSVTKGDLPHMSVARRASPTHVRYTRRAHTHVRYTRASYACPFHKRRPPHTSGARTHIRYTRGAPPDMSVQEAPPHISVAQGASPIHLAGRPRVTDMCRETLVLRTCAWGLLCNGHVSGDPSATYMRRDPPCNEMCRAPLCNGHVSGNACVTDMCRGNRV
jgi:hypothetical protein